MTEEAEPARTPQAAQGQAPRAAARVLAALLGRLGAVGGTLDVSSFPGQGTTISARIPAHLPP